MSDASGNVGDDQDLAEQLDGDRIDPVDYPPDDPLGVMELLEEDVPLTGEYAPDSLEERSRREVPDRPTAARRPEIPPELLEPDDPFGEDQTKELIAQVGETHGGYDDDVEAPLLTDSEQSWPDKIMPAEEAAIHVIDEDDVDDDLD